MAEIRRSSNRKRRVPGARKIRYKELPVFTRQLSAMLDSGMPLVQCLMALEDQTENKNFKVLISGVRTRVEGGASYSDALKNYPTVFDDLYISMMNAGEAGGILSETTERVASFLESSNKLRRKVKSAMMYPMVVMSTATILALLLIIFVLPKFTQMFADFNATLPAPTRILLGFSNFVRSNGIIVIVCVAVAIYSFIRFKNTEKGSFMLDGLRLKIPILGTLVQKVAISRFASTFAQLMHSGVPILRSMEIVGFATGNQVIGKAIIDARDSVERGEPLSSSLDREKHYPRMLIHMLKAGEKTGKVEEMMSKIAEFYEDEVNTMVTGLTSMIEPLLMVFVGLIIGSIVIAMFLPIFKMSQIVN